MFSGRETTKLHNVMQIQVCINVPLIDEVKFRLWKLCETIPRNVEVVSTFLLSFHRK